jgi:hypothetical protein
MAAAEAVHPFRHAVSTLDFREVRNPVHPGPDFMNKAQTIAAQLWLLRIHSHLIKKSVQRRAKTREDGHRAEKILTFQQGRHLVAEFLHCVRQ